MARSPSADRYVVTVPVATTPAGRHQLDRKFEAARQQHNAVLGQLLRRHRAARRDRRWQTAASTRDAAERRRLYDAVCADVRLSERALGRWAMDQLPRCHLGDHLGCHETQATVARVWDGYQRWITRRAGPPRFRGRKRPVRSVQGTGKASPLRVDAARREVVWSRPLRDGRQRQPLRLALQLDPHDECHRDLVEALDAGRYTQTRLVRERINGRDHYHAQIVCVGRPPVRGRVAGAGRVGIDLGPAKVAVVTDQGPARLTPQELPAVADMSRELRRLQRRWDRQHRAGSPDCFGGDGTHVRGRCRWRRSARARRTGAQIADLKRRLRQTRKAATGRLVNQIAEAGGRVHAEDLDYRTWTRRWGKAVAAHAPGELIARLRVTLALLDGELVAVNPYATRLSQTCLCGRVERKPLSQRTHHCPGCDLKCDRDVLAAHLVRHAAGDSVDLEAAHREWYGWAGHHRHGRPPAGEVDEHTNPRHRPRHHAEATTTGGSAGGPSGSPDTSRRTGDTGPTPARVRAGKPVADGEGALRDDASGPLPTRCTGSARVAITSGDTRAPAAAPAAGSPRDRSARPRAPNARSAP